MNRPVVSVVIRGKDTTPMTGGNLPIVRLRVATVGENNGHSDQEQTTRINKWRSL